MKNQCYYPDILLYLCTRFKNNLCVVGKNLNCAVNQTVGYLQGTRFPPGNFSYYTY